MYGHVAYAVSYLTGKVQKPEVGLVLETLRKASQVVTRVTPTGS